MHPIIVNRDSKDYNDINNWDVRCNMEIIIGMLIVVTIFIIGGILIYKAARSISTVLFDLYQKNSKK